MATHAGMTTDEFATIVADWLATARHPTLRPALHRDGLPADARAARLPARERLQDVHRLRRRRRVHAALGRARLRRPARAGRRQQHHDTSTRCATASRCSCACPRSTSSTTRPASPSGIHQHIGRRPIAGLRQLGRRLPDARVDHRRARGAPRRCFVHHDDARARVGVRPGVSHRAGWRAGWMKPPRADGSSPA
ncbi:MAG: hypothetical protein MZV70_07925 [Desulfobacterales bacterium]|nr:hypothetical protein [Desulfobacterales bacterium]